MNTCEVSRDLGGASCMSFMTSLCRERVIDDTPGLRTDGLLY